MFWKAQGTLLLVLDCLLAARCVGDYRYEIVQGGEHEQALEQRVDAYLRTHYHEPVTLDQIARHVRVSRSTLTHRYRERTGTTPKARLTQYRVDAARAMILRGERLKVVALRTGFCDEFHLSKAFKKATGVSPRRYIQSL